MKELKAKYMAGDVFSLMFDLSVRYNGERQAHFEYKAGDHMEIHGVDLEEPPINSVVYDVRMKNGEYVKLTEENLEKVGEKVKEIVIGLF